MLAVASAMTGWTTLALVLVSSLLIGANRPATWTLLSIVVLVLFLVRLALDLAAPAPRSVRMVAVPALLALGVVAWGMVQTLPLPPGSELAHPSWALVPGSVASISADPIAGRHIVMRLACYLMVFWIVFRSAGDFGRAMQFARVIAVFVTAVSGFGLYAFLAGENWVLGDLASAGVVSATFGNRNSYATFAAFGLIANVALYIRVIGGSHSAEALGSVRLRVFLERFFGGAWVFAFGTLLCAAGLVLSQSRAGAAAGFLGVLVLLLARRRGRGGEFGLALTLGGVFAFVLGALSSGLSDRLLVAGDDEARFLVYSRMLPAIAERPLLGHGLGAFQDVFRGWMPIDLASTDWSMAHNTYLENAFELGLPAMAALAVAVLWLGVLLGAFALERAREAILARIAFASLVAASFHAAFDFSLQIPAILLLLVTLLALGIASRQA